MTVGSNSLISPTIKVATTNSININKLKFRAIKGLPADLKCNEDNGEIYGIPTIALSGTYSIQASYDNFKTVSSASISLTIKPKIPKISYTAPAAPFITRTTISPISPITSGGGTPSSYAVTSGSLPPGLSFNSSTGVISGIPTTAGSFTSSITASNSSGSSTPASISFTVKEAIPKISYISPAAFTKGIAISNISPITSDGGTPSSYAVTSGSLPPGLSFNSSTGVISGIPTTAGSFTSSITASNSSGSSTPASISFTVKETSTNTNTNCTEPTITSISSDNSGPNSIVTITGCGFSSTHKLAIWQGQWIGGLSFTYDSSTQIRMRVPLGACSLYAETIKLFSGAVEDIPTPSFVQNPTSTSVNLNLASIAPTNPGTTNTSCITDSGFDACIFYKNPVAQQGKIFSPVLSSTTDLSSIQTYGVKIDATGQTLDNNNLSVCGDMDGTFKRFFKDSSWKTTYLNSRTNFELEQVMAYYWLNQQINTMKQWTGNFYAANKKIQVFAHNPFFYGSVLDNAFWSGDINLIVMGRSKAMPAVTYGLAAEILAHEMGHANLDYAAPDAIVDSDSCADKNGCIGAIHEGQADYHAALMFGPGPIGESITNNMGGLSESACTIGRTISKNSGLTADKVYNPGNCFYNMNTEDKSDDIPARGEIHDMGALYASIWWEVRKNAAVAGKSSREVDQLFMEHLAALQSADNFVTSLCKIIDIDKNNFSSRYSQLFSEEYKKRGLPGLESCP